MTPIPPIVRQVIVNADPPMAFDVFTGCIGRWWPLADFGVYGEGATVSIEDGDIVEVSPAGERSTWGSVTRWERGVAVAFTWHPAKDPDRASQVEVKFNAAGPGITLVTLEHRGWEVFSDPEAARQEYDHGWPIVLDGYRRETEAQAGAVGETAAGAGSGDGAGSDAPGGDTWVALMHRAGPAAPREGSVFQDPRFGQHVAFLKRMAAAGYLVAAGPLGGTRADGMTVLRLPGEGRLEEAMHLATVDDASVASGFFVVDVRSWQVMMHALLSA